MSISKGSRKSEMGVSYLKEKVDLATGVIKPFKEDALYDLLCYKRLIRSGEIR